MLPERVAPMPNSAVDPNETPRSSQVSSPAATLSPTWQPPKAPLTPHRLAKLANALGISTPLPATLNHPPNAPSFLSRSFSESAGPDHPRRSPTPSAGFASSAATSKFLLHVIPPLHLLHDSDDPNDADITPPPPTASGYHTQFRRGTLVTVHPTLQAQLGAIAREYALPSTAGLVLYLVSSVQSPITGAKISPGLEDEMHDPGPRLSEEIWRHLWTRVVQVEQRDANFLLPSRSPTPLTLGNTVNPPYPFLSQASDNGLRPPNSPSPSPISPRPSYHLPVTSPSPPSPELDLRSNTKSAPPSSASASQFDQNTPNTPISADSLDLPGLFSPAFIPILAKVEFDIDRRKAGWYDPWIRSRRANHAKRARSRKNSAAGAAAETPEQEKEKEKVPVIPLLIGRKETSSPLDILMVDPSKDSSVEDEEEPKAVGYEQLSDTQDDLDSEDEDEIDFAEDSTARVSSMVERQDPLEDVFGSDADTWSDIKGQRRATHEINPNDISMALTAEDLTVTSFHTDDDFTTKEEEEVRELLIRMSHSGTTTPDPHATFSPQRKVPPPLVLVPNSGPSNVVAAEPSPFPPSATNLAYLDGGLYDEESALDDDYEYRSRSPAESEKRSGALFEDLDLGLDPSDDYDDDDPNDRRKSQIVMKAQLDEIEKTLAQLSPRFMKTDLEDDMNQSYHSMSTLSPNSPAKLTLSPLRQSEQISQSRLPPHLDPPSGPLSDASWPAVPFSQIKESEFPLEGTGVNPAPSTPQLALNGVTTSAPVQFNPQAAGELSSETNQRKKELEEDQAFFRKLPNGIPVIPLSPDPFGRFSLSTAETPPNISEPNGWDTTTMGRTSVTLGDGENHRMGRARSGTTASRFSVDSIAEEAPVAATTSNKSNRGTLISVKSIKNLWRKSNRSDKDKDKGEKGQTGSSFSGRISPAVPQRPERPSQETLDLPDVPPLPSNVSFGRVSPQPMAGGSDMARRPSQEHGLPPRAASQQSNRSPADYMVQQQQQQRHPQDLPPPRRSQDAPPPMVAPGLAVPPYANANRNNTSPIVPAQMLSNRPGAGLDRFRFDQESPYPNPIRNAPPVRYAPRPPSPPQASPPLPQQQQNSQFSLPSIPEQDKFSRKSIVKWKSGSSNSSHHFPQRESQQRTSFDRASITSSRTNGSGGSHGQNMNGSKASINSISSDFTPHPSQMVPDRYNVNGGVLPARAPSAASSYEHGGRVKTPVSPFESGSPPVLYHRPLGTRSVSPAASFGSSHASIDESQFEIVSPTLHAGFSYPIATYSGQHEDA